MDAQAKEIKNKVMCEINSFAIVYIDIINSITGGIIDFFQIPITEVSSAILTCDHPYVTEDR
jgi:hypothetical protein